MTGALILTAALMGAAGIPHCAGMCSAGCAAAARRCAPLSERRAQTSLAVGRLIGYAVAGAVVAAFAQVLRWSATTVQWLHPLWSMLQVACVLLGVFLLVRGRLPERLMDRFWPPRRPQVPAGGERVHLPGELRAAGMGLGWAVLPCGLLQAALVLAALASSPWEGAAVMLAFGVTSLPGLLAGAAVWQYIAGRTGLSKDRADSLSLRLAGAGMAVAAAWPLWHAVGEPLVSAWCA